MAEVILVFISRLKTIDVNLFFSRKNVGVKFNSKVLRWKNNFHHGRIGFYGESDD